MSDPLPTQAPASELPRGEYKMVAILWLICLALFVDSLRSPGIFQGESAGPGSIPQILAAALLLMLAGLALQHWRRGYREGRFGDLLHHLFDQQVVVLLTTLTIYGFVLETLHFVPATFLFLVSTMYLLERRHFWFKVGVSAGTLALLYLIFNTLFRVVLP